MSRASTTERTTPTCAGLELTTVTSAVHSTRSAGSSSQHAVGVFVGQVVQLDDPAVGSSQYLADGHGLDDIRAPFCTLRQTVGGEGAWAG